MCCSRSRAIAVPHSHDYYGPLPHRSSRSTCCNGRSAAGVWKLIVRDQRAREPARCCRGDWYCSSKMRSSRNAAEERASQMIPVVAHVLGVGATRFHFGSAHHGRESDPQPDPQP